MSVDTSLIGRTAAELMESLPEDVEGEVCAVAIVVVVDDGDGTYTRTKCSTDRFFEQLGLFHAGLDCITTGATPEEDE